jgi:hypothetical protein
MSLGLETVIGDCSIWKIASSRSKRFATVNERKGYLESGEDLLLGSSQSCFFISRNHVYCRKSSDAWYNRQRQTSELGSTVAGFPSCKLQPQTESRIEKHSKKAFTCSLACAIPSPKRTANKLFVWKPYFGLVLLSTRAG